MDDMFENVNNLNEEQPNRNVPYIDMSVPSDFEHKKFEVPNSVDRHLSHCHKFEITHVEPDTITKQMVFDALKDISTVLVVGQELHENRLLHFHVYMETINPAKNQSITWKLYQNLRMDFKIFYDYCKKPNAAVKYATKKDPFPLKKEIKTTEMSTVVRTYHYAKRFKAIDASDPELIADQALFKAVRNSHHAIREKLTPLPPLLPIKYIGRVFGDSLDMVIEWLNGYIMKGWEFKAKQLYVYGPSGVGKTTMINMLLGAYFANRFSPPRGTDNRFTWSAFNPKRHNHVVIDEYKSDQFNATDLNLLLSGECLVTDKKFKNQQDVYMKCPIIICSNFPPEETMPGFVERLSVIKIEKKGIHIKDISKWIDYDDEVRSLPLLYTKHKPKHGQLKLKTPKFLNEILLEAKRHDEEVENGSETGDNNDEEDGLWVDEEQVPLTPSTDSDFTTNFDDASMVLNVKRRLESALEEFENRQRLKENLGDEEEFFRELSEIHNTITGFLSTNIRTSEN